MGVQLLFIPFIQLAFAVLLGAPGVCKLGDIALPLNQLPLLVGVLFNELSKKKIEKG